MPTNFSYWKKQDKPLFKDLDWNIPEQKSNHVAIIGGNSQNFAPIVKISEFLATNYPVKTVETILPDALKSKLPPALPNLTFLPSTTSGSFDRSPLLAETLARADFLFFAGDLTKNSITAVALSEALKTLYQDPSDSDFELTPDRAKILLTRDAVDLLIAESEFLLGSSAIYVASMVQLQKVFRAVYYPRAILLSAPLMQIVETLHKFTLSYPVTIVTFHEGQILVANAGKIISTPIENTKYTPISLWSGELASHITAMNLWTPTQSLEATAAAILK
ncbi:hypothetical protein IJJ46_02505 [Candidatus Saccharibacteria bacterium]|nr:hypothetical protein [Candidatus Saccharibacteria bacterium]